MGGCSRCLRRALHRHSTGYQYELVEDKPLGFGVQGTNPSEAHNQVFDEVGLSRSVSALGLQN